MRNSFYGIVPAFPNKALCHYAWGMKSQDKKPLAREADKFIVRLPEGMREKIMEAAEANNRSMNAEIVDRLLNSFEPKTDPGSIDVDKLAKKITDALAKKLAPKSR